MPGSSLGRHLELGVDPGNEVAVLQVLRVHFSIKYISRSFSSNKRLEVTCFAVAVEDVT